MSIEFQIRSATLAAITARSVCERLRNTCLPVLPGASIDHLEVVPGAASVEAMAAGLAVHVPVDVYIVDDQALMAAPNGTPVGATMPAGRIDLTFLLGVELKPLETLDGVPTRRAFVTLRPAPINHGQLPPLPDIALPTLSLELTAALQAFGMPVPDAADIVIAGDTVAVRFNPSGAARAQLFPGQDWGLFVGASTAEAMVDGRLGQPVRKAIPKASVEVHYEVIDGDPRVGLKITLAARFDAFELDGRIEIDIGVRLILVPRPVPMLRLAIDWSFHLFVDLVFGVLEEAVEDLAEGIASDLIDPRRFGATPTGERSFVIDLPLPTLAWPGVQLGMDTLEASHEGMTLGGAVRQAAVRDQPFAVTVHKLGSPMRLQTCSELARAGSGARSTERPSIHNTKSYAQVDIDGCGALCAVDQRTPARPLNAWLTLPTPGAPLEAASLRYAIPYDQAMTLGEPLRLVVRTPRGVRLVDLGMAPAVQTDADGVLLGRSHDYYLRDCINVVPGSGAGAGWGNAGVEAFKTRPIEEPDWAAYLQQAAGLVVQLVTVDGLDAGELLRFRSATHEIDVTADALGSALVPVMLPLAGSVDAARLARADGRSLEGHVAVDSAVFERHLTLAGGLGAPIAVSPSGALIVTTRVRKLTKLHTVTAAGASSRVLIPGAEVSLNPQPLPPAEAGGLASLNPQPLPPVDSPKLTRAWGERFGLHGLAQVFAVPGHAGRGAAVAVMADGTKLMLDLRQGGTVRICGSFAGPIGTLESAGRWAVASVGQGHEVAVFGVRASEPASVPRAAACGCAGSGSPADERAPYWRDAMRRPCSGFLAGC